MVTSPRNTTSSILLDAPDTFNECKDHERCKSDILHLAPKEVDSVATSTTAVPQSEHRDIHKDDSKGMPEPELDDGRAPNMLPESVSSKSGVLLRPTKEMIDLTSSKQPVWPQRIKPPRGPPEKLLLYQGVDVELDTTTVDNLTMMEDSTVQSISDGNQTVDDDLEHTEDVSSLENRTETVSEASMAHNEITVSDQRSTRTWNLTTEMESESTVTFIAPTTEKPKQQVNDTLILSPPERDVDLLTIIQPFRKFKEEQRKPHTKVKSPWDLPCTLNHHPLINHLHPTNPVTRFPETTTPCTFEDGTVGMSSDDSLENGDGRTLGIEDGADVNTVSDVMAPHFIPTPHPKPTVLETQSAHSTSTLMSDVEKESPSISIVDVKADNIATNIPLAVITTSASDVTTTASSAGTTNSGIFLDRSPSTVHHPNLFHVSAPGKDFLTTPSVLQPNESLTPAAPFLTESPPTLNTTAVATESPLTLFSSVTNDQPDHSLHETTTHSDDQSTPSVMTLPETTVPLSDVQFTTQVTSTGILAMDVSNGTTTTTEQETTHWSDIGTKPEVTSEMSSEATMTPITLFNETREPPYVGTTEFSSTSAQAATEAEATTTLSSISLTEEQSTSYLDLDLTEQTNVSIEESSTGSDQVLITTLVSIGESELTTSVFEMLQTTTQGTSSTDSVSMTAAVNGSETSTSQSTEIGTEVISTDDEGQPEVTSVISTFVPRTVSPTSEMWPHVSEEITTETVTKKSDGTTVPGAITTTILTSSQPSVLVTLPTKESSSILTSSVFETTEAFSEEMTTEKVITASFSTQTTLQTEATTVEVVTTQLPEFPLSTPHEGHRITEGDQTTEGSPATVEERVSTTEATSHQPLPTSQETTSPSGSFGGPEESRTTEPLLIENLTQATSIKPEVPLETELVLVGNVTEITSTEHGVSKDTKPSSHEEFTEATSTEAGVTMETVTVPVLLENVTQVKSTEAPSTESGVSVETEPALLENATYTTSTEHGISEVTEPGLLEDVTQMTSIEPEVSKETESFLIANTTQETSTEPDTYKGTEPDLVHSVTQATSTESGIWTETVPIFLENITQMTSIEAQVSTGTEQILLENITQETITELVLLENITQAPSPEQTEISAATELVLIENATQAATTESVIAMGTESSLVERSTQTASTEEETTHLLTEESPVVVTSATTEQNHSTTFIVEFEGTPSPTINEPGIALEQETTPYETSSGTFESWTSDTFPIQTDLSSRETTVHSETGTTTGSESPETSAESITYPQSTTATSEISQTGFAVDTSFEMTTTTSDRVLQTTKSSTSVLTDVPTKPTTSSTSTTATTTAAVLSPSTDFSTSTNASFHSFSTEEITTMISFDGHITGKILHFDGCS